MVGIFVKRKHISIWVNNGEFDGSPRLRFQMRIGMRDVKLGIVLVRTLYFRNLDCVLLMFIEQRSELYKCL